MKGLNKTRYRYILIIGNGFDLDLGLPTRYTDFLVSKPFENEIINNNDLANHFKGIYNLKEWIDIEEELKNYSQINTNPTKFLIDYQAISNSLLEYISSIDYANLDDKSAAFKLIKTILETDNVLIIDFNYTNSLKEMINKSFGSLAIEEGKIEHIKIHGGIDDGEIIFGVDDEARIKKEHIFLKKSANKIFKPVDFSSAIEKSDFVIFFGHSLGVTDHMYFDDYFSKATIKSSTPRLGLEKQNIVLFYYGEQNYYNLLAEIDILTRRRLKELKQFTKFEMVEVKK